MIFHDINDDIPIPGRNKRKTTVDQLTLGPGVSARWPSFSPRISTSRSVTFRRQSLVQIGPTPLVSGFNPSEKYESMDTIIPYISHILWNIKHV